MRVIRSWRVLVTSIVITIAITLAGIVGVLVALFPDIQQQTPIVPYIAATLILGVLANAVIAIMSWCGISPTDFLPPLTLEERLKRENPNRYLTSKNTDTDYLGGQVDAAAKRKEYTWMYLFVKAWVALEPKNPKALERLCEAYLGLKQYNDAITTANKLIEYDKLNYEGFTMLGGAFFALGDLNAARSHYETALALAPETRTVFISLDLQEVYRALGDIDKAIERLEYVAPNVDFNQAYYDDELAHLKRVKQNLNNRNNT